MTTPDLRWAGAAEVAEAIRHGRIASRQVLEDLIDRIETLNPPINAVVSSDWRQARQQADQADAQLARGSVPGPLHGVSMTVKDLLDVKGLESTAGSRQLAG